MDYTGLYWIIRDYSGVYEIILDYTGLITTTTTMITTTTTTTTTNNNNNDNNNKDINNTNTKTNNIYYQNPEDFPLRCGDNNNYPREFTKGGLVKGGLAMYMLLLWLYCQTPLYYTPPL